MINEIMGNTLKVSRSSEKNSGHYRITPYSYTPSVAKKLIANPFIDLGQGLLKCIQEINKDLDKKLEKILNFNFSAISINKIIFMIKTILWDFDGVILDSLENKRKWLSSCLKIAM